MSAKQPNIVLFFWDNFGWGELGCYGGGVLRGAPTSRIDKFCSEGKQLLTSKREMADLGLKVENGAASASAGGGGSG